MKPISEGGLLDEKYGKVEVCSELSHRIKNMVKKIYELQKRSGMDKRMATCLDLGIRASARALCNASPIDLQNGMKGAILHCFNVHSHYNENFCNVLRGRMDGLRLLYGFKLMKQIQNNKICLPCKKSIQDVTNTVDDDSNHFTDKLRLKTEDFVSTVNETEGNFAFLTMLQATNKLLVPISYSFFLF